MCGGVGSPTCTRDTRRLRRVGRRTAMADTNTSPATAHRHERTGQYVVGNPDDKGQIIDLGEVRRRLDENQNPTTKDFFDALMAERREVDRLTKVSTDVSDAQGKMQKHFKADVLEVVREAAESESPKKSHKLVNAALVLAVLGLAFGLLGNFAGWSAFSDASSAKAEARATKNQVEVKADRVEVKNALETKANKAEVENQLKTIETKAEMSVVDRLVAELRARDGTQDQQISDIATRLMAKAEKEDVNKIAAKMRQTTNRVGKLEKRIQELRDAVQEQQRSPK